MEKKKIIEMTNQNSNLGVGSDFLVKVLRASRMWCLAFASVVFGLGQLAAIFIENPNLLFLVSGFTGLGYGFLYGVYPSIIAEEFGIHGLSQNWGFMMLSPVISSNIFNLMYGLIYDANSVKVESEPSPEGASAQGGGLPLRTVCRKGIECYRPAYLVTLAACVLGLAITLGVIRHQHYTRGPDMRRPSTRS